MTADDFLQHDQHFFKHSADVTMMSNSLGGSEQRRACSRLYGAGGHRPHVQHSGFPLRWARPMGVFRQHVGQGAPQICHALPFSWASGHAHASIFAFSVRMLGLFAFVCWEDGHNVSITCFSTADPNRHVMMINGRPMTETECFYPWPWSFQPRAGWTVALWLLSVGGRHFAISSFSENRL